MSEQDLYEDYKKMIEKCPHLVMLFKFEEGRGAIVVRSEGGLAGVLRLTNEKIQGQNPVQVFSSEVFKQHLIAAFNGKPSQFEIRFRNKRLSCALEPYKETQSDKFTEVVGTMMDVTEQRKIELKSKLLAQALISMNDAVAVTDSEDMIIYVNPAFTKLYQYSEAEVLGKNSNFLRSIDNHNPQGLTDLVIEQTLAGGWEGQIYNRRKDGKEFLIYLRTSVVRDSNGEIIGFVGISRKVGD